MSNPLAIAAATATLRNLVEREIRRDTELADIEVTVDAPDTARDGVTTNQLNIFLYNAAPNGAWRNADVPGRVANGEAGHPALSLDLSYLLTAYGRNNDGVLTHRVLGRAMVALHDHPVLDREDIRLALGGGDLHRQMERVRVSPHPMSLEEMSKLWSALQTEYRISAAYDVSVVMLESEREARAALPVLLRGTADRGVAVAPDLLPPYPALFEAIPPSAQPSIRLGESLILRGARLEGDTVRIRFRHPLLPDPILLTPTTELAMEVAVALPDGPAATQAWVSGIWSVAVVVERTGEPTRVTNELPLAVSPVLPGLPSTVVRDAEGVATVSLGVAPEVRADQHAVLLLGDRAIPAEPHTGSTGTLTFRVPEAATGTFLVRLRVDGVDSILVDRSASPPVFDPGQEVTIT